MAIKLHTTLRNGYTNPRSELHLAPEMFNSDPKYLDKSDIFSLGVILYSLIFFEKPFKFPATLIRCDP